MKRFFLLAVLVVFCTASGFFGSGVVRAQDAVSTTRDEAALIPPSRQMAAQLFGVSDPPTVLREDAAVPGWSVSRGGETLGHIASTWDVIRSVGYSGRPIDVLVAVSSDGVITGARLVRHSEPILTLGLSDADIERFVAGFEGIDLSDPEGRAAGPDMPDIISRATVSTGVIRDSILRTARLLAINRGLVPGGGIDRLTFEPLGWQDLETIGAVRGQTVTLSEARAALPGATPDIPEGTGAFVALWGALMDPPTIGRNILGETAYNRMMANLGPDRHVLFLGSHGLYSHRGIDWRRSGVFDRLQLVQGEVAYPLTEDGYTRLDELAIEGAPPFKERSLFQVGGAGFDPALPFEVVLTASRATETGGEVSFSTTLDYQLPTQFVTKPPPEAAPLWHRTWEEKKFAVMSVAAMQIALTLIMLFQQPLVRRKRLWAGIRIGFLTLTLVWLGWVLNGQLSVVQVVAFVQSLLTGFRWETFLIEPVIFTLWAGVALGMLFWGRGVFCGWLCPFGALQELSNLVARRFGVRQIAVPPALHERLWIIKYTLFMAILALSFYSMRDALILAEVEPFKTAISMRMMRAWPFVAFVLVLLFAGLFIERFYCRYLCPLGAALAIPAKLKIFDWLRRRPQCGRECRLCETKCTVGAIDPLGRINPNECVLCMRCQVILHDADTCPVLKRRARSKAA
ncbi:4Fe-4S binding protein [Marivita sp. S2033]|uniref:4Fe-4S binding protein n=1 Tax=Marivita sp. S2033 TaxID=3373187 RepID=UPI003982C688